MAVACARRRPETSWSAAPWTAKGSRSANRAALMAVMTAISIITITSSTSVKPRCRDA
jgi:hypothetical protein